MVWDPGRVHVRLRRQVVYMKTLLLKQHNHYVCTWPASIWLICTCVNLEWYDFRQASSESTNDDLTTWKSFPP